jgi:site-specific DNA recombinase
VRAIGYSCLNTLSQKPKNLTLEDQEGIIRAFVAEQNWELVDIYQETTTSTNSQSQPILERIITDSGTNRFDVLVIARLDRLTRNIRQLNTLINEMCMTNNVQLISIEEGFDTRTDCGKLGLRLIDIITKWDTKRISDRTREIIARKRAKKLVAVDSELNTVRLIREQRDKGQSYHKIAKYLNDRKISSKRGGIWYAETVKTVYQNSLNWNGAPGSPMIPTAFGTAD